MSKFNPGDRIRYTGRGPGANRGRFGKEGVVLCERTEYGRGYYLVKYDDMVGPRPGGAFSLKGTNATLISAVVDETEAYFV